MSGKFLRYAHFIWIFYAMAFGIDRFIEDGDRMLGPLGRHRMFFYDLVYRLSVPESSESRIAVVGIDSASIKELGAWPFSRAETARLLDAMNRQGANVIALNILYAGRSENPVDIYIRDHYDQYLSLNRLQRDLLRFLERDLPEEAPEEEKALIDRLAESHAAFGRLTKTHEEIVFGEKEIARAITQHGGVVLGDVFLLRGESENVGEDEWTSPDYGFYELNPNVTIDPNEAESISSNRFPTAIGAFTNGRAISEATEAHAFLNDWRDADGKLRRSALFLRYGDRWIPSLPMAAVLEYEASRSDQAGKRVRILPSRERVRIGEMETPNLASVLFRGDEYSIARYSWIDVVENRIPPGALKGKIVFLGALDPRLGDIVPTPVGPLSATEVMAQIASSLLDGETIRRSEALTGLEWGFIPLIGLSMVALLDRGKRSSQWLYNGAVFSILFFGKWLLFAGPRIELAIYYPVMTLATLNAAYGAFWLYSGHEEKRRIRRSFSHYLAPEAIERLERSPKATALGGVSRNCTILVCRSRDFRAQTGKLLPKEMVSLLNAYHSRLSRIALEAGGAVQKLDEDEIVAFFGAPLEDPDHARNACLCALGMREALASMRESWEGRGWPALELQIGINTGPMIVGDMGSDWRMNYAAIGEAVDLAFALEKANAIYGSGVLIGQATYERLDARLICRYLDRVRSEETPEPARVYELLGEAKRADRPLKGRLEAFNRALAAYEKRQFDLAADSFETLLAEAPDDGATRIYLERSRKWLENPPSPNWDAVHELPKFGRG